MEDTQNKPILFALGNTFIDCYGVFTRDILDKYKIKFGVPGNLSEEQLPVLKDLESSSKYLEFPGGSAINTIRALNYLMKLKKERENTVLYFGTIGKDEKGRTIKKLFDEEGILYKMNEQEEHHTGQCAVIIVESERTPLSYCGVNDFYETKHFEENMDLLSNPEIFYVEG